MPAAMNGIIVRIWVIRDTPAMRANACLSANMRHSAVDTKEKLRRKDGATNGRGDGQGLEPG